MATANIKQVAEAVGAPADAAKWSKNLAAWGRLYACRPRKRTLELKDGTHSRRRRSLNMAKRVAEDWASLLWTENARVSGGGDKEAEVLEQHFGRRFVPRFSDGLERTFALGTGALEVRAENLTINETTGEIAPSADGRLEVDFVAAPCILPLKWNGNEVDEVAFVSWGDKFVDVRCHRGDESRREITNTRYKLGEDGKLSPVELPEGIAPVIVLEGAVGVPVPPLFAILRPAITNNLDADSPFGVSVFANAVDQLETLDLIYDNFGEDFELGGKMVFVPDSMIRREQPDADNPNGKPIPPQADRQQLFVILEDPTSGQGTGAKVTEHNPDLRVEDNTKAIQAALSLLSNAVGMGAEHYSYRGESVVTATQVVSENSDLFRNRRRHLLGVNAAVESIASAVLWCAKTLLGTDVDPTVAIEVAADDSVIEDDGARIARGLSYVSAGVLSELTFLIDYLGYPEPEDYKRDAAAELARIREGSSAQPLFG